MRAAGGPERIVFMPPGLAPVGVSVRFLAVGPVTARAGAGLITGVDLRSPTASFESNAGDVVSACAQIMRFPRRF